MKLTDKIHLLQIDFEIALTPDKKIPRFVNVLLVFGEKITLIDTGVKGSEKKIFDYIKKQNRDPSEINSIILSHAHPDHIGSAAKIKELLRCKVYSHELERDWIENIELQNKLRPVPGFYNLVDRSVLVDEFISDNHKLVIQEGLTLKFIRTSGHSKGMLSILFEEDKILFTADAVPLKNDIPNYENFIELMDSLETIKKNNELKILLTSWTPPLIHKEDMNKLIGEGEEYMKKIDSVVKQFYKDNHADSLDNCKLSVEKLGLPLFLVNPIVDKAFRSHLNS